MLTRGSYWCRLYSSGNDHLGSSNMWRWRNADGPVISRNAMGFALTINDFPYPSKYIGAGLESGSNRHPIRDLNIP
jgi:hypothetical protein